MADFLHQGYEVGVTSILTLGIGITFAAFAYSLLQLLDGLKTAFR